MCRYWGRGTLGAVITGCVVCDLGVRGLWGRMFDVFGGLFWVVVLSGGLWPQVSDLCVCVCVCVRARARGFAHLVFPQERKKNFNECERM